MGKWCCLWNNQTREACAASDLRVRERKEGLTLKNQTIKCGGGKFVLSDLQGSVNIALQ